MEIHCHHSILRILFLDKAMFPLFLHDVAVWVVHGISIERRTTCCNRNLVSTCTGTLVTTTIVMLANVPYKKITNIALFRPTTSDLDHWRIRSHLQFNHLRTSLGWLIWDDTQGDDCVHIDATFWPAGSFLAGRGGHGQRWAGGFYKWCHSQKIRLLHSSNIKHYHVPWELPYSWFNGDQYYSNFVSDRVIYTKSVVLRERGITQFLHFSLVPTICWGLQKPETHKIWSFFGTWIITPF